MRGGLEDTFSLVFFQLPPHILLKQNAVYAYDTDSLHIYSIKVPPVVSLRDAGV